MILLVRCGWKIGTSNKNTATRQPFIRSRYPQRFPRIISFIICRAVLQWPMPRPGGTHALILDRGSKQVDAVAHNCVDENGAGFSAMKRKNFSPPRIRLPNERFVSERLSSSSFIVRIGICNGLARSFIQVLKVKFFEPHIFLRLNFVDQ